MGSPGAARRRSPCCAVTPESLAAMSVLGAASLTGAWGMFHPRASLFGPVLWRGPRDRPQVALTFDDGPYPGATERIADSLAAVGATATFFCVGRCVERYPELALALHRAGHELENHTFSHGTGSHLFRADLLRQDLERCQEVLQGIRNSAPRYYRPAVGIRNPVVHGVARALGLEVVTWTRSARDGLFTLQMGRAMRLASGVEAGTILALHDGALSDRRALRDGTVRHLPMLLRELKARGFALVTLEQLLTPA